MWQQSILCSWNRSDLYHLVTAALKRNETYVYRPTRLSWWFQVFGDYWQNILFKYLAGLAIPSDCSFIEYWETLEGSNLSTRLVV